VRTVLQNTAYNYSFYRQKMTDISTIKYILCILEQMKRSYIEVGYRAGENGDPLRLFASMLREKYGGDEEVEESNQKLLQNLVQRGQIPKSSIIWHQDKITKIYGFKIDDSGKIEYDITGSNSPDRRTKTYITNTPKVDMSAVRDAILRSKQAAI